MNDDYISRGTMLINLTADLEHNSDECDPRTVLVMQRFIKYVEEFPAVDVQPVKRGRWIETHISLCKWIPENEKEEGHRFYMAELKCSCCERYNTVTFSLSLNKPDFCQLCGARMDLNNVANDLTDEEVKYKNPCKYCHNSECEQCYYGYCSEEDKKKKWLENHKKEVK